MAAGALHGICWPTGCSTCSCCRSRPSWPAPAGGCSTTPATSSGCDSPTARPSRPAPCGCSLSRIKPDFKPQPSRRRRPARLDRSVIWPPLRGSNDRSSLATLSADALPVVVVELLAAAHADEAVGLVGGVAPVGDLV